MLKISKLISIAESEMEFIAIKAQGPGGQNVNKVSSAIHLRFDIQSSNLPDFYKQRLLSLRDKRINKDGVIVIKAQQYRSQEKNKVEALMRLGVLIKSITVVAKKRKQTKPTFSSNKKRLETKARNSLKKKLRGKIS